VSALAFVVGLSLATQLAAAVASLRLIWVTGRRRAWVLISAALLLMVLRRMLSLLGAVRGVPASDGDLAFELVGLVASLTLLTGLSLIAWVFREGRADAEEARRLARAVAGERDRLEELVRERTATIAESEERFRALAESSADVIMRFDRRHRHLYANPAVEGQTGIPAADFVGRTHAELGFPAELVTQWERAIDQVFASTKPHRIEFELPTGVWIDWLLIPELTVDGDVRSVITTARDITHRKAAEAELARHRDHLEQLVAARTEALQREVLERRRTEQALRQSEERFRTLHDNVPIGLYRTTVDGRVLMANPAFVRMLGCSSFEELARVDLNDSLYAGDFTRADFCRMVEERDEVEGLQYRIRRPDGTEITVRDHARAIRAQDGTVTSFEGAVEDVTRQAELEQHLREAQRMEAIGHLAGGMAHDFNNLLMAVAGSAEMLERRLSSGAETPAELAVIQRSVQRANELIRGLLAFARRQVLSACPLEINQVVREILPMLERMIPESVDISFSPGPEPLVVRADRSNLDQVLVNLAVNARDAMPDGGRVTVLTRRIVLGPESLAEYPWAEAGPHVELVFADTGTGMAADTLARAFEPFFTTKEPGKGTGMGLATVYGIVRQHGGVVRAESVPGGGTTVRIALPEVALEPVRLPPRQVEGVVGGSETILVAEDDNEVRTILVEALGSMGYTVLEAPDGVEAVELLRRRGQAVDLVLTDLVMPRMGGRELFEAIRRESPTTRFLFSSGYADGPARDELLARGEVAFLSKPFRISSLAAKVREVLDQP